MRYNLSNKIKKCWNLNVGYIELDAATNTFVDHLSLDLLRSSYNYDKSTPADKNNQPNSSGSTGEGDIAGKNASLTPSGENSGGYQKSLDKGKSKLVWQTIGNKLYGEALNLTTDKPFEISFRSLADATLRIVTIEEHPFVIKKVETKK